jgi:hypothetical protein
MLFNMNLRTYKHISRENSVISMFNGEYLRNYKSHQWKNTTYIAKIGIEVNTPCFCVDMFETCQIDVCILV